MKRVILLLTCICANIPVHAQFKLNGSVTSDMNEPLPGAYVILRDTYYRTITDNEGRYEFSGIKSGSYLVIVSYIGYEPKNISVDIIRDVELNISLMEDAIVGEEIVIEAVRASRNTPTTFTVLNKDEINKNNAVQDLPYILNSEPSLITTSDAGAGVGYTSLRIRGSDITRINVTINGIPLNDPESHAVYWVDIPDIASSINSIQVQRGVGSSTNGAGAFGASMNMETNTLQKQPFGEINLTGGSFNTWKTSFQAGTGLINDHFYLEARISAIGSDGYIDRAFSKLKSYFLQTSYFGDKTNIKALVFGGNEKTYQAWYGMDESTLKTNRTFNWAGVIFDDNGGISFYDNQTDNYQQDHYQLHLSHQVTAVLNLNLAAHYTYGRGYYEEYKQNEDFANYGLDPLLFGLDSTLVDDSYQYHYSDTVHHTDLIQRRWLDNHFYGITWSFKRKGIKSEVLFGGAYNKYDKARHFGEIIWAEYASQSSIRHEFYNNTSYKSDFNVFLKATFSPLKKLTLYGDLQYRHISYQATGLDNYQIPVDIDAEYNFFNPKIGMAFESYVGSIYGSLSIAHREPIRDDFLYAEPGETPEPEILRNLELGVRKTGSGYSYSVNFFLMNYVNQLILTGEINEDGAYIRKNTGKSYRTGLEMTGEYLFTSFLGIGGNISMTRSRTDYRQVNAEGFLEQFENVTISFSPWLVGGIQIRLFPAKNFEMIWNSKYVSKQFLDNTGNENLTLKGYLVNDVNLNYMLTPWNIRKVELRLLVNNIFNTNYESNGYVWDSTPYYYPQAGINFLAGILISI